MRTLKIFFVLLAVMSLSACNFLGEVNDSIDYVNIATDHIDKLNTFAGEAPQLIQEAATDTEVRQNLETQLVTLKQEIEEFISITEVPSIAENIHQEFVNKNELLLNEINKVLANGHLALDQLQDSQIVTTINDVTNLLDRIENLGL